MQAVDHNNTYTQPQDMLSSQRISSGTTIHVNSNTSLMNTSNNSLVPPSVNMDDITLAGFRDCSEEAIRYLLEVEGLSENDPVIVGLREHLHRQRQQLEIKQTIADYLENIKVTDSRGSDCNLTMKDDFVSETIHHTHESIPNRLCLNQNESCNSQDNELTHCEAKHAHCKSNIPLLTPSDFADDINKTGSMLELALLAQNNPSIASLTEEILQLMDDESDENDNLS